MRSVSICCVTTGTLARRSRSRTCMQVAMGGGLVGSARGARSLSAFRGLLRCAGGDAGVAARVAAAADELRGLHRDGGDGGPDLVSGEVPLAGEALSVYSGVAHRLLRR